MTTETAPTSRKRASNPNRGAKPGERRGGRQKGTPNKVTKDIREAIRELLEECAPKMSSWLDAVAKDNPGKALELALRAAEYAVPKLSRAEIKSAGEITLEALVATFDQHPPTHVVTGVPDPKPDQPAEPAVEQGVTLPPPLAATPATPAAQGIPAAVLARDWTPPRRGGSAPAPRAAQSGDSAEPYNPLEPA